MNKFEECVNRVIRWSNGIDLYNNSTAAHQRAKAFEEVGELVVAIDENNLDEIKDAIGDILVCVTNVAHLDDISGYFIESYNGWNNNHGEWAPEEPKVICMDYLLPDVCSAVLGELPMVISPLVEISRLYSVALDECFEIAVNVIEKRKLLMDNGKAVKWENMTDGQRDQWRVLNENN